MEIIYYMHVSSKKILRKLLTLFTCLTQITRGRDININSFSYKKTIPSKTKI